MLASTRYAIVAALLALVTPVLAQVDRAPESPKWIPIVVSVILVVCVLVVSIMSSKREHRD